MSAKWRISAMFVLSLAAVARGDEPRADALGTSTRDFIQQAIEQLGAASQLEERATGTGATGPANRRSPEEAKETVTLQRCRFEVVRIIQSVEKFSDLPHDTQIHIVGCYMPKDNQPIGVHVSRTGKPMVVILTCYNAASWNLHIADGADVRGVILSGHFDQRFSHMAPRSEPVIQRTYFPVWKGITSEEKEQRAAQCFYVWSPLESDFPKMTTLIRNMTGREPTTFQGEYTGHTFLIDGQRGSEEYQIAKRWQTLHLRADKSTLEYYKALAELEHLYETTMDEADRQRLMNRRMDELESLLPPRPAPDERVREETIKDND